MQFYASRTIRWYVTVEISFIRESIRGDKQTTATFSTSPEIMADVSAYDPRELLVILFNHMTNFLSVESGWRFDSAQRLAISLYPFRPTIGVRSVIETHKSLHKKWVLNIQNLKDDYCFLWCILGHIYIQRHPTSNTNMVYHYKLFFNELGIDGLQFPLKFSDTHKFENLRPSISVNVMVF